MATTFNAQEISIDDPTALVVALDAIGVADWVLVDILSYSVDEDTGTAKGLFLFQKVSP